MKAEAGVRLAGAVWWFWDLREYLSEGRAWLERAVTRSTLVSSTARAMALLGAGWLAHDKANPRRRYDHSSRRAWPCSGNWVTSGGVAGHSTFSER